MWIVIIAVAVFCLALTVPCLVLSDFVSKNKNKGLKRINAFKYSSFVLLLAVLLTYLVVVARRNNRAQRKGDACRRKGSQGDDEKHGCSRLVNGKGKQGDRT